MNFFHVLLSTYKLFYPKEIYRQIETIVRQSLRFMDISQNDPQKLSANLIQLNEATQN